MVKMVLGSSDAQATSVSTAVENYTNTFTQASQAVSNLAAADTLSGAAYDNVKSYASTVITPLLKGFQLYAEATETDVGNFPQDYRNQVGDEDLDSEVLQQQISAYNTTLNSNNNSLETLKAITNRTPEQDAQISSLNSSNETIQGTINQLQGKLDKLNEFEKNSPNIFKDLSSLEADIRTGLNQLSEGVSSFDGKFTIPKKKDLKWADHINSEFKQYQNYQSAVNKVQKGEELSKEEAKAVEAYQKKHPAVKIDKSLTQAVENRNYQDVVDKAENGKELTDSDIEALVVYAQSNPNKKLPTSLTKAVETYAKNKGATLSLNTKGGINFSDFLDKLFGSTHSVGHDFSIQRDTNWLGSIYTKTSTKAKTTDKGIITGSTHNGIPNGFGLDLGFASISADVSDWHLNLNPQVSLPGGYQFNIKADVGFNSDTFIPEVDLSFGYGKKGSWSQDWGLKASLDLFNGVIGGYGRHTNIDEVDSNTVSETSTESGFQTGNGLQVAAVVAMVFAPELLPSLAPTFL